MSTRNPYLAGAQWKKGRSAKGGNIFYSSNKKENKFQGGLIVYFTSGLN
jgi:hypothetical protein